MNPTLPMAGQGIAASPQPWPWLHYYTAMHFIGLHHSTGIYKGKSTLTHFYTCVTRFRIAAFDLLSPLLNFNRAVYKSTCIFSNKRMNDNTQWNITMILDLALGQQHCYAFLRAPFYSDPFHAFVYILSAACFKWKQTICQPNDVIFISNRHNIILSTYPPANKCIQSVLLAIWCEHFEIL